MSLEEGCSRFSVDQNETVYDRLVFWEGMIATYCHCHPTVWSCLRALLGVHFRILGVLNQSPLKLGVKIRVEIR